MQRKRCTQCRKLRHAKFFYPRSDGSGLRAECKFCNTVYARNNWRKNNPNAKRQVKRTPEQRAKRRSAWLRKWKKVNGERQTARHRRWKKENPDRVKDSWYKCNYGMTLDELETLWRAQGKRCAVCRREIKACGNGRGTHVDHTHTKRKHVRGLLCGPCNQGLGLFRERKSILERAVVYLAA